MSNQKTKTKKQVKEEKNLVKVKEQHRRKLLKSNQEVRSSSIIENEYNCVLVLFK